MRQKGHIGWSRYAHLCWMLVLALLCAQWISLHHSAEYGDGIHTHGGHICEMSVHADRDGDCLPPSLAVFEPRTIDEPATRPLDLVLTTERRTLKPPARAPPHSHA